MVVFWGTREQLSPRARDGEGLGESGETVDMLISVFAQRVSLDKQEVWKKKVLGEIASNRTDIFKRYVAFSLRARAWASS